MAAGAFVRRSAFASRFVAAGCLAVVFGFVDSGNGATLSGSLPCSAASVRRRIGSLSAADAALALEVCAADEAKRLEQPSTGAV